MTKNQIQWLFDSEMIVKFDFCLACFVLYSLDNSIAHRRHYTVHEGMKILLACEVNKSFLCFSFYIKKARVFYCIMFVRYNKMFFKA